MSTPNFKRQLKKSCRKYLGIGFMNDVAKEAGCSYENVRKYFNDNGTSELVEKTAIKLVEEKKSAQQALIEKIQ